MNISSSWPSELLLCIPVLLFAFHKYFNRKLDYWKRQGVRYVEPKPFIGNFGKVITMKEALTTWIKNLHDSIDEPYFGIYLLNDPCLVVKCPRLIQQIFVKDFSKFTYRGLPANNHDDILSGFLVMQRDHSKWRTTRAKLAPIFSLGKLKSMFPVIDNIGGNLVRHVAKYCLCETEAKELCSLYALDVITQCAFGLDAKLLNTDVKPEFWKVATEPFQFNLSNALPQILGLVAPTLLEVLNISLLSTKFKNYFVNIFLDTVRAREEHGFKCNDMIDVILDLKNKEKKSGEQNFCGRKVSAPAIEFLLAGSETTNITISFFLYEMAMNPEIQETLRSEILSNMKKSRGLTYDGIISMKYLDMCITESLRKYPVVPFWDRICTEDYQIPDTDVVIKKGQYVIVSLMGLHHDPNNFPCPEKFDPDRFNDENNINTNGIIYAPFGHGPRKCIGDRFALLSAKVAICHLLSNFVIEKTDKTPSTIQFETKTVFAQSSVGLPVRFKRYI